MTILSCVSVSSQKIGLIRVRVMTKFETSTVLGQYFSYKQKTNLS